MLATARNDLSHSCGKFGRACVALVILGALLSGCTTYRDRTNSFMIPYQQGKFEVAAAAVDGVVGPVRGPDGAPAKAKVDREDQLLFRMQQGQVLRSANRWDDSIVALRSADELIDKHDEQAKIRLSQEMAVALTNQRFRDYEPFQYDRLAVQLNLALAFLQKGDIENARIPLRAMQQRQEQAEEYFAKQIEKLEKKEEKGDTTKKNSGEPQADVAKIQNDPGLQSQFKKVYGDDAPTVPDRKAIRKFVNPFGEYIQGIYFLAAGTGPSDYETATVAFRRVLGMLPNNPYVMADLAEAERVANGSTPTPTTYVFFETGLAPYRDQIRIDIPLFLINIVAPGNRVPYVGAAFPVLKYRDGHEKYLVANAGGTNYQTNILTNMDEVIKTDFNNELPNVIFRTIFATATKAAASYGINKAAEGNSYALVGTMIATTVYQAAMNEADLRTWEALPKQFQVARFNTPADRKVVIGLPSGAALPPIEVIPGTINVIYVKSTSAGQPLAISQFKLK